jgi:hypothetical protein
MSAASFQPELEFGLKGSRNSKKQGSGYISGEE